MSQETVASGPKIVHMGKRRKLRFRFPRVRLRYLCLAAVFGWAAYVYFFVQGPVLHRLTQQANSLTKQVQTVEAKNKQLSHEVNQLSSNDYIARIARENYGLVKPGDIVYQPSK